MKRKDLHDPRGRGEKFFDQMYGAPKYTFILSREQLLKCLGGLESVEDKNWRIKSLIDKIEGVLSTRPVSTEGTGTYLLPSIDATELHLMKNFITVTVDMLYSTTRGDIGGTTTEFEPPKSTE